MATPQTRARWAQVLQEVSERIVVVPPYETQYDAELREIVRTMAQAGAGYATGGRACLGTCFAGGGGASQQMRRLSQLTERRASLVAGLTAAVAALFWVSAFLNQWQVAHVDTLTDSMRAMQAATIAEELAGAAALRAGLSPGDAEAAEKHAAAKIRLLRARAMLQDPHLMNVLRLNLTLFDNRVISFISEDGYEIQLLQQPGNCWGGDWAFVTKWRHGSRPLYKNAASIIACFRTARRGATAPQARR